MANSTFRERFLLNKAVVLGTERNPMTLKEACAVAGLMTNRQIIFEETLRPGPVDKDKIQDYLKRAQAIIDSEAYQSGKNKLINRDK